jgi:hypothetical protein
VPPKRRAFSELNPEDCAHNALIFSDVYFNVSTYSLIGVLYSYYNSTEQVSTLVTLLSFNREMPGSNFDRNINATN